MVLPLVGVMEGRKKIFTASARLGRRHGNCEAKESAVSINVLASPHEKEETISTLSSLSLLLLQFLANPKGTLKKKKNCQRGLSTRKANRLPGARHPGNPGNRPLDNHSESHCFQRVKPSNLSFLLCGSSCFSVQNCKARGRCPN